MLSNKKPNLIAIAFNHSLDIDFKDHMNIYKNVLQKQFFQPFLVTDTTFASENL